MSERSVRRPEASASPPVQGVRLLHLLAVAAMAIAQPLFDVLARHPEFLLAHGLVDGDRLWLALLLAVGVPVLLWLPQLLLGRVVPRASWWAQSAIVGGVLATMVVAAVPSSYASTRLRAAILLVAGLLVAAGYRRWVTARRFLAAAAIGALVFPGWFLWRAGVDPSSARGESGIPPAVSPAPGRPPLVLVVLDELPLVSLLADPATIDGERFPHLAALADQSHWFVNAVSVAQSTSAAVPAIVTGRYPRGAAPPTADGYPDTLFSRLREAYELNVVETLTELCGRHCSSSAGRPAEVPTLGRRERLLWSLEDLAAVYLASRLPRVGPPIQGAWSDFWRATPEWDDLADGRQANGWREQAPQRFARFIARLEKAPRETFHYLHLSLPHLPWQFLPDGTPYRRERGVAVHGLGRDGSWSRDEWEVVQAQQRHLLQLAFADRLIGRLVAALQQRGDFDEALMVVTADHGASFRAGDKRRILTQSNLGDIAHVPLFVKLPRQREGVRHEKAARLIDIVPTIAAALDFDPGTAVDGRDLLADGPAPTELRIYRSWYHGGAGKPWVFEVDRLAESAQAIAVKRQRFPTASLYVAGRDRHLLGVAVDQLPRAPAEGHAEIAALRHLLAVDPDAELSPAHVMGRLILASSVSGNRRLALALDGVIRAVTETYGKTPAAALPFTAMIDPSVLTPGEHSVEVFVVQDGGGLAPATVVEAP